MSVFCAFVGVLNVLACVLCSAGADVMVTDQTAETGTLCEAVVDDIRGLGRRAASAVCDVRNLISVKEAVQQCKE